MGRFSPRERAAFLALKAVCYGGLGSSELLALLGDRLGTVLRADATCMVQFDPDSALPTYVVSQGWAEEDHRPLIEHALLASPAADPGRLVEQGRRTVAVDEIVPADQPLSRDPYFEHHLFLRGYRHELQTVCTVDRRGRVLVTMTRREQTGSFEPRHARLLDALAPHIAAGLHAATVRETLGAPAAVGTGFIVLNPRGDVELASTVGERWLATPDVAGRPGRLWALHVLAKLLERSLTAEGAGQVPEIELADPSTGTLHRLRAERALGANGDPRTIILIEPIQRIERPATLLRFGLTPREAEVALGFLRGASIESLAREAKVSPHTIDQHRRNVFSKLDVSSRRELLARFLYQGF